MDRLQVRISRCSLALSLAVTLGLATWAMSALLRSPTVGVALMAPGEQLAKVQGSVELAQARKQKRRSRSRRERDETETEPQKGSGKEDAAKSEQAPSEANKTEAKDKDAAATEEVAPDHQALDQAEVKEEVWSDAEVIAALEECVQVLAPIAAHVEVSKPIRSGQCGSPAAVVVRRVGREEPVEISPPAVVNCRIVATLHHWVESTLQPAAHDLLDAPIVRMINASGYVCRNRNGAKEGKISEHAFANALDISAFVTARRQTVDVLTHWGKTERDLRAIARAKAEAEKKVKEEAAAAKAAEKEKKDKKGDKGEKREKGEDAKASAKGDDASSSKSKNKDNSKKAREPEAQEESEAPARKSRGQKDRDVESHTKRSNLGGGNPRPVDEMRSEEDVRVTIEGQFLRRLHKGACGPFTTVLGPEANEAHRNHFHFDLAERRRNRAFCE